MAKSPTFFAAEIHSGGFIPHRWLFEDFVESTLAESRGSNIYYLVRAKKIRFLPHTFHSLGDGSFFVDLKSGASERVSAQLSVFRLPPLRSLPRTGTRVELVADLKKSSGTTLHLVLENRLPLPLFVDSFLALNNLAFSWRPEVLYVGQSSTMLNRWRSHKQVNRATSILGDDEELRLYYLHFRFFAEFERFGDTNWNQLLEVDDKTSPEYADRISLLEQALIQYYRPVLNTQLLDATGNTAHIRRIAAKTGITCIRLSLGMEENAFQFFSAAQVRTDEVVTWNLQTDPPIFLKGLNLFADSPTDAGS